MSQVAVTFTGDAAQLVKELAKLQGQVRKLEDGLKAARRAGKEQKETHEEAFGSEALAKLKSWAGALTGAGGLLMAWRLINAELRQHLELQRDAAQAVTTLEGAQQKLLLNMVGATPEQKQAMLGAGKAIARETRVDEKVVAQALADAISAFDDAEVAKRAVAQAAKTFAHEPAAISMYAGSLLDLSAALGTTDVEALQGFLAYAGSKSRITDAMRQAKNIPPALVVMTGAGATPTEALAAFSALTKAMKDKTGEMAGTAAISMAVQLRDFLPGLGTMGERIAALQADRGLAQTFLEGGMVGTGRDRRKWTGATFERKAQIPLEQLFLQPSSEMAAMYAKFQQEIPGEAGLKAQAQEIVGARMLVPGAAAAEAQRAFEMSRQQLLASRLIDAEGHIAREGLEQILRATGLGWLGTKAEMWSYEGATMGGTRDPLDAAAAILEARARALSSPRAIDVGVGAPGILVEPSAQNIADAAMIRELVTALKELTAATKQQRDASGYPLRVTPER